MINDKLRITRLISLRLSSVHRGKENAITRKDLLNFARFHEPLIEDRELRKIYSELIPAVSSQTGIYWPVTEEELLDFKAYLKKKAISIFNRWQRVAVAHPELGDQRNLFDAPSQEKR